MAMVHVEPESIRLNLPHQGSIWISLGEGRDLMNELIKIFQKRVQDGKGLL